MIKNNNIATISLSILLNVVILFPLSIQFFHVLDDHKHIVCTDNSTHLHKSKMDCNICDFTYTPFIYEPLPKVDYKNYIKYKTSINTSYNYLYSYNFNPSKTLRGPPVFS